jgi:hypothetical protein
MSTREHGLTSDGCIAMTDAELVDRTFGAISQVADLVDVYGDALYFLVDEMLERFAPDVARADIERRYKDDAEPDNLLDAIEGLRRRQAARLLRDTVGSDDDA